MKVLDAGELHAGLKRNIEMLNRLEGEMQIIENAIKEFTQMEESLKGQGGQALRNFYSECHLPFLQFFLKFKESFNGILEQMGSALTSLEPDQTGFIEQTYLEVEVEQGINDARHVTEELTNETNAIMDSVSDIVSLPKLDNSEVMMEIVNAKNHRDQTVTDLLEFDHTQTISLTTVENDLKMMSTWIGNIQHLMIAGLTDAYFSTPRWNLLTFISLSNPLFSSSLKLNEILRMSAFNNPQKDLQAFSNGIDQEISNVEEAKTTKDELEALYKAIANGEGVVTVNHEAIEYMEKHNISTSSPEIGPNGEYVITFEGMRKVLGGNGSGTPDGLAPYAVWAANFFFEDIGTLVSPNATMDERLQAAAFTFFKPAKLLDNVSDVLHIGDSVKDVANASKKGKNSTEIESVQGNTKGIDKTRPTWRQSEIDEGKDFPEYDAQKSFKDGKEVPYGEKGSSRPDFYKDGHSIEVKNYNITTSSGRSRLVNNISKQVEKRLIDLPSGSRQSVTIDIRGQDVSDEILEELYGKIMENTGGKVDIRFRTN